MMSHNTDQPAVGYKNPPQHSRFQKGRSGNPSGRRKAKQAPDLLDAFAKLMAEPVQIKKKGKLQNVSMIDAFVQTLMDAAFKGNAAARKDIFRLLDLMKQGSDETTQMTTEQEAQLLEGFLARRARADGGRDD
jgi:hypothetical protein